MLIVHIPHCLLYCCWVAVRDLLAPDWENENHCKIEEDFCIKAIKHVCMCTVSAASLCAVSWARIVFCWRCAGRLLRTNEPISRNLVDVQIISVGNVPNVTHCALTHSTLTSSSSPAANIKIMFQPCLIPPSFLSIVQNALLVHSGIAAAKIYIYPELVAPRFMNGGPQNSMLISFLPKNCEQNDKFPVCFKFPKTSPLLDSEMLNPHWQLALAKGRRCW